MNAVKKRPAWMRGAKSARGFTPAQRPRLNAALAAAWAAHCAREDAGAESRAPRCARGARCKSPACEYCAWYVATLEAATGHTSTTECNAGRDYDHFLAALEVIAGDGIASQLARDGGDAKRILHAVAQIWPGHDLDERYLRGIAATMRGGRTEDAGLPALAELTDAELRAVRIAAVNHARRKADDSGTTADCPF